jgi:hypothetical protein
MHAARRTLLAAAMSVSLQAAVAQDVSLRLGGKEVPVAPALGERLAALAKQRLARCGPNTLQHPGNFGLAAAGAERRWQRLLEGSRLRVVFAQSFVTESHLGGTLGVSEALIGLEGEDLFVGPDFTRHGGAIVEHLRCEYLPALELACLSELAPHLPARYRETCARLERDAGGRIVMPPPDIAPSCS